ncbi:hypothetical protein CVT24_002103 [Panaeolus cyanescens]|uniref:Uncharacterized protein n=1 Tax=Panaeolus cyanescens TaxID=181874 RepID=A0A409YI27_9AGAR|nr:hypothetical protein CVT24_002103 [Panaeolus cyanescens]
MLHACNVFFYQCDYAFCLFSHSCTHLKSVIALYKLLTPDKIMAEQEFTLIDEDFFPSFEDLPEDADDDLDLRYYDDSTHIGYPIKHWCLLVEIVRHIPYLRPMYIVKDRDDHEFLAAFYLDRDVQFPPNHPSWHKWLAPGNVMAIMYAHKRAFMDGQVGVRIEDVDSVKACFELNPKQRLSYNRGLKLPLSIFPHTLQSLYKSRSSFDLQECQVADWKPRHRRECATAKQIAEWSTRDWTDFEDFWSD